MGSDLMTPPSVPPHMGRNTGGVIIRVIFTKIPTKEK